MESLLEAFQKQEDVAITDMYGLERSRFFLRSALNLFTSQPQAKVYHVLDKDRLVERVYQEATLMPFNQFGPDGIQIAKGDGSTIESDPNLIICSLSHLFKHRPSEGSKRTNPMTIIIFDVTTLESLEGTILDLQEQESRSQDYYKILKRLTSRYDPSSVVLTGNAPLDEHIEPILGLSFRTITTNNFSTAHQESSTSFRLYRPNGTPLIFGGPDAPKDASLQDKEHLHNYVGFVLESLIGHTESDGIIVFFPTYGKMVEFHNAWQKSGLFERIGLPYGRENRGGDHFKRGLHKLATEKKSIFLCSIRYHQDEELADMVMGRVRAVLIVGLPYPIMSDTWTNRMKIHDTSDSPSKLDGNLLYKYRAIDFMNGIIKRCLINEYRFKSCKFIVLDKAMDFDLRKLVMAIGNSED